MESSFWNAYHAGCRAQDWVTHRLVYNPITQSYEVSNTQSAGHTCCRAQVCISHRAKYCAQGIEVCIVQDPRVQYAQCPGPGSLQLTGSMSQKGVMYTAQGSSKHITQGS